MGGGKINVIVHCSVNSQLTLQYCTQTADLSSSARGSKKIISCSIGTSKSACIYCILHQEFDKTS